MIIDTVIFGNIGKINLMKTPRYLNFDLSPIEAEALYNGVRAALMWAPLDDNQALEVILMELELRLEYLKRVYEPIEEARKKHEN